MQSGSSSFTLLNGVERCSLAQGAVPCQRGIAATRPGGQPKSRKKGPPSTQQDNAAAQRDTAAVRPGGRSLPHRRAGAEAPARNGAPCPRVSLQYHFSWRGIGWGCFTPTWVLGTPMSVSCAWARAGAALRLGGETSLREGRASDMRCMRSAGTCEQ